MLRVKRTNVLRECLRAGRPSLGTHLHVLWPGMVEVIGCTRAVDYVEFVAEYAPYDLFGLENFCRAVDLFPNMSSMMKIEQEPKTHLAVRALGSGFENLLFADIRSVEDARAAVAAVRAETPQTGGIAGAAMRRDVGYVVGPGSPDYVRNLEDAVVAVMIEKKAAIEDLEAILDVPGVDMVQFGPADYSMSIGLAGQWDHPRVKEAERCMIETALKKGVAPRVELPDFSLAGPYLEMGVKHFCVGWDVAVIHGFCRKQGELFRRAFGL